MKNYQWLTKVIPIVLSAFICQSGSFLASLELEPIATFNSSIPGNPIFSDGYGQTVRFNGEWVFVAAPIARAGGKTISGAVYVYKKSGNSFKQTQIITTDGESDHLGALQIEAKDDWLLISLVGTPAGPIPNDTLQNQDFTGSIQIYHLHKGQWTLHSSIDRSTPGLAELSVIDPNALNPVIPPFFFEQGANFGLNFSLDWKHRVLLVGAQYQANLTPENNVLINVGAVYAFHFNDGKKQWELTQKIVNPDGLFANDAFGANVVTNKNYALISNAPIFQAAKPANGFVYVFKRTHCNTWEYIQRLQGDQTDLTLATILIPGQPPAQVLVGDAFGDTLALRNGHAIVGAPFDNLGTSSIRGAAYFYELTKKGQFKRVFKAISEDPTSQGFSFPLIRIHDKTAYLSDTTFSGSGGQAQGAIAVYQFKNGKWHSKGNLLDPNPAPFNFFGQSFDIRRNTIGVGSGLFGSGFVFFALGTPPLVNIPLPYPSKPFTIFKIKKD
jgi:hypothetical protein